MFHVQKESVRGIFNGYGERGETSGRRPAKGEAMPIWLENASEGLRAALAQSRQQLGEEHYKWHDCYARAWTDDGQYMARQSERAIELRYAPTPARGDVGAGWDLVREEPVGAKWEPADEWVE